MPQPFSMIPEELAAYKGFEAYHAIESKYLNSIRNPEWLAIARAVLTMEKPITKYAYTPVSNWAFPVAPGSGAHHRHFGGLALHTLQNLEYAAAWADIYEARSIGIDRDLLLATILIHDAMKRFIYKFDDDFNFIKVENLAIRASSGFPHRRTMDPDPAVVAVLHRQTAAAAAALQ